MIAKASLRQHVERAEALFNDVLAKVEERGLVDLPRDRLRCENLQDRIYVMQYFYYRRWHDMSIVEFAETFPEVYERLCEIMPRRLPDEEE